MADKRDELRAFKKLGKRFPGRYITVDLEMKKYSDGVVKHTYRAYVGGLTGLGKMTNEFENPMDAVDEAIKLVEEIENATT
jgi:hypothetical protein